MKTLIMLLCVGMTACEYSEYYELADEDTETEFVYDPECLLGDECDTSYRPFCRYVGNDEFLRWQVACVCLNGVQEPVYVGVRCEYGCDEYQSSVSRCAEAPE